MNTTEVETFILTARKLLKPSPVRLHHIPRWLVTRIKERIGKLPKSYYPSPADYLYWGESQTRTLGSGSSWLDHFGSTVAGNRPMFVSEPYLAPRMVADAARFAERLGLAFTVSSNSFWFPANTTRLAFWEPSETTD